MKKPEAKSFELNLDVKSAVPIYEQVKDAIKMAVFTGKLREGDKIISIREVASRFNINPITILKSYNQLEYEGLLFSRRGAGYYIKIDEEKFQKGRKEMLKKEISQFFKRIANLGYTRENLLEELNQYQEERNPN